MSIEINSLNNLSNSVIFNNPASKNLMSGNISLNSVWTELEYGNAFNSANFSLSGFTPLCNISDFSMTQMLNKPFTYSQMPQYGWNTFSPMNMCMMPFNYGMPNFNIFNSQPIKTNSGSYSYDENTVNNLERKWKSAAGKHGLGHDFFQKVVGIANKIKCDPNSLLCMIHSESRFKYKQKSGLYGNIYKDLTNVPWQQQLDMMCNSLVEKREKYYGNRTISDGELYAMNFLPARIKNAIADPKHILTKRGEKYYSSNATLDKEGK